MKFGGQTITFVHYTQSGTADALGHKPISETRTDAPNCRHRPLTFTEIVEAQLDVATEMWRSTIPVHEYGQSLRDTVMTAEPEDAIEVDGQLYQIVGGVRTHPDAAGIPFKATIISKKQIG